MRSLELEDDAEKRNANARGLSCEAARLTMDCMCSEEAVKEADDERESFVVMNKTAMRAKRKPAEMREMLLEGACESFMRIDAMITTGSLRSQGRWELHGSRKIRIHPSCQNSSVVSLARRWLGLDESRSCWIEGDGASGGRRTRDPSGSGPLSGTGAPLQTPAAASKRQLQLHSAPTTTNRPKEDITGLS